MDYLIFEKDPLDQGRPIVVDRKLLVKLKKEYTTNHYVMVMVVKGEGTYKDLTTGQEYPVKPGTLMQRFIGRSHSVVMKTEDNEQYYLRIPMEAYLACKLMQNIDASPCVFQLDLDEYISVLDSFVEENKGKTYQELLLAIIPLVLKLHSGHRSYIEIDEGSEVIRRASRILTNDLKTDLDLEWLADLSEMGYKTFRRRFKKEFGCSPGAFRLKYKMETAEHYLKHSEITVQEISLKLGYSSAFAFSRQFKKEYDLSPHNFRLNHKNS